MLAALIIVFREVLEAGIIVGIMLAVTRGIAHRGWWIGGGGAAGALGACVAAGFAGAFAGAFGGDGEGVFQAAVFLLAGGTVPLAQVLVGPAGRGPGPRDGPPR